MPNTVISKTYRFNPAKEDLRGADIEFGRNYDGDWGFLSCKLIGVEKSYTLDDWKFLGELSKEIKILCEQEGVVV